MNRLWRLLAGLALVCSFVGNASAALYISDPLQFGTRIAGGVSDGDDVSAAVSFPGVGQTINFFGTVYSVGFVTSNGLVNFGGSGFNGYSPQPLDTQTFAPMIAGLFTDLYASADAGQGVFVNDSTPGQLVVTWYLRTHFPGDSTRSTFQLVIRSSQFAIPAGEGQIGFFYNTVTDTANVSAGFGDGLAAVNPGEQAFYNGAGTGLSNAATRWFTLSATGVPVDPGAQPTTPVSVPTLSEWSMILLAILMGLGTFIAMRRRNF